MPLGDDRRFDEALRCVGAGGTAGVAVVVDAPCEDAGVAALTGDASEAKGWGDLKRDGPGCNRTCSSCRLGIL